MSTRGTEEEREGPEPRYWRITIDLGGGKAEDYGGTVASEQQAYEQAPLWLRHYADKIEREGARRWPS